LVLCFLLFSRSSIQQFLEDEKHKEHYQFGSILVPQGRNNLYTLPIHESKMGVKLGDTFWGMCTLMNPLDWSQNPTAILQAASRVDFSN
jgi:hypothetical protein